MPDASRVIAVGLLTQKDLDLLGSAFRNYFPVDETPCFGQLLSAIDDADRIIRLGRPGDITPPDNNGS